MRAFLLAGCLSLLTVPAALAQTELGGQRVATSSGTFLKIGVDARGAALAGAYNAIVGGPNAIFVNPAGLVNDIQTLSTAFSYTQWPADIDLGSIAVSRELSPLGGRLGFGLLYLDTSFEETTEYHPLGTGRTVSYSDFLFGASFARNFTDRLAIGVTLKYLREDLASNVDGTVAQGMLMDAGTVYTPGYRNAKLAITLAHFGPDIEPEGSFRSQVLDTEIAYTAFAPPTQFLLGFAIDPYVSGPHRMTLASQVLHQADNAETFRGGIEYTLRDQVAFRGGYDFSSDEMGFAAGLGLKLDLAGRRGSIDYAFTEGGHLESVHRLTLGIGL